MNIAILSHKPELYSTRRLEAAARQRGHNARVIDYLRCTLDITSERSRVLYGGQDLDEFEAIIPRVGASNTFYGTAVVRQFEMMGVFTANSSQAISRSRDKLCCLQLLSREGIGLPATGVAHSTQDTAGLVRIVGGAPLVIKLIEGAQGVGVVLAETKQAAEAVIEAFRGLEANILVQEFVQEAQGKDIRCFVVGGEVVAAMERRAPPGEFRSNLHRGGTPARVRLTDEERSTAIRSAEVMGLSVAGVDILRTVHGPAVIEVNSSPGLEGIESTTEVDVAGKIIDFVEQGAWALRTEEPVLS